MDTIQVAAKYKNTARFKTLLREQSGEGLIHVKGDFVYLTQKGIIWIEKHIDMDLQIN